MVAGWQSGSGVGEGPEGDLHVNGPGKPGGAGGIEQDSCGGVGSHRGTKATSVSQLTSAECATEAN